MKATDFKYIKNILYWADHFDSFAFLTDNNFSNYLNNGFENLLAVGDKSYINSISELKSALTKHKWIFGHFAYDLKNQLEQLSSNNSDIINSSDISFFTPLHLLKFNGSEFDVIKSDRSIDKNSIYNFECKKKSYSPFQVIPKISKTAYEKKFNKIQNHISEGDVYELNLCQEFYAKNVQISPIDAFLELNKISPMPFSALYKTNGIYTICASPERFIKKCGDKIISQPIKGTNKASEIAEENALLQQQLKNSEKERAENMMIVDLVRNDLSKSAKIGTVDVEELFGVYKMNHVNQMISTISAQKREDISDLDVILNAFPMGSMTGAPKIEAMKLIENYEESKRGLFSGSIGYFAPNTDFDFNVVIRSIIFNSISNTLSYQVGGAITSDSVLEDEYNECLLKASAMSRMLDFSI